MTTEFRSQKKPTDHQIYSQGLNVFVLLSEDKEPLHPLCPLPPALFEATPVTRTVQTHASNCGRRHRGLAWPFAILRLCENSNQDENACLHLQSCTDCHLNPLTGGGLAGVGTTVHSRSQTPTSSRGSAI